MFLILAMCALGKNNVFDYTAQKEAIFNSAMPLSSGSVATEWQENLVCDSLFCVGLCGQTLKLLMLLSGIVRASWCGIFLVFICCIVLHFDHGALLLCGSLCVACVLFDFCFCSDCFCRGFLKGGKLLGLRKWSCAERLHENGSTFTCLFTNTERI